MKKCTECDNCIGNKGKGNDKWDKWNDLCWDCENKRLEGERIERENDIERIRIMIRKEMYLEKNKDALEDIVDIVEEKPKKFIIRKYRFID